MAKVLSWVGPTTYTNGTAFGQADYAGYELQVNGEGAVALPVAWSPSNQYSFDIETLAGIQAQAGEIRTYNVALRTVARNGQSSDWSQSVAIVLDLRIPNPPTSLAVAS